MNILYYIQLHMYHGASKDVKPINERDNMNYTNKISTIVAVVVALAICFVASALATGPAQAVTAGSIEIEGIDADGKVTTKAYDVTVSATGTDINQTVLMGKEIGGAYVTLETWDYTGTNTSIEEVYEAEHEGQVAYVYKLCIFDDGAWDNTTLAEVSVEPYMIPMMNNDETALNLVAYAGCIIIGFVVVKLVLERNDKTNKAERKEGYKDMTIGFVLVFIVITGIFVYLGGYYNNILAWVGL